MALNCVSFSQKRSKSQFCHYQCILIVVSQSPVDMTTPNLPLATSSPQLHNMSTNQNSVGNFHHDENGVSLSSV